MTDPRVTYDVEMVRDENGPLFAVVAYEGDDAVNCWSPFYTQEEAEARACLLLLDDIREERDERIAMENIGHVN